MSYKVNALRNKPTILSARIQITFEASCLFYGLDAPGVGPALRRIVAMATKHAQLKNNSIFKYLPRKS